MYVTREVRYDRRVRSDDEGNDMNLLTAYAVHADLAKVAQAVQNDVDARAAFVRLLRALYDDDARVAELDAIDAWVIANETWLDTYDA